MFGCKTNSDDRDKEYSSGQKKRFISLEKCSEEKVKTIKEQCLAVAQR